MKKGKSAVKSGSDSVGLQMVRQYYVSFNKIGVNNQMAYEDDDYGTPVTVPIGKKGARTLNLPTLVQASSFIEAVQKIDKFMLDNDLAGKYSISRLEENHQSAAILA